MHIKRESVTIVSMSFMVSLKKQGISCFNLQMDFAEEKKNSYVKIYNEFHVNAPHKGVHSISPLYYCKIGRPEMVLKCKDIQTDF